jgi:regulator of replication initiation timing
MANEESKKREEEQAKREGLEQEVEELRKELAQTKAALAQALEDKKKLEKENQDLNETLRSVVTTKKKAEGHHRKNTSTSHDADHEVRYCARV